MSRHELVKYAPINAHVSYINMSMTFTGPNDNWLIFVFTTMGDIDFA